jgi:hypothetical protein
MTAARLVVGIDRFSPILVAALPLGDAGFCGNAIWPPHIGPTPDEIWRLG